MVDNSCNQWSKVLYIAGCRFSLFLVEAFLYSWLRIPIIFPSGILFYSLCGLSLYSMLPDLAESLLMDDGRPPPADHQPRKTPQEVCLCLHLVLVPFLPPFSCCNPVSFYTKKCAYLVKTRNCSLFSLVSNFKLNLKKYEKFIQKTKIMNFPITKTCCE